MITVINSGTQKWPKDTHFQLNKIESDLKIVNRIEIGNEVPVGAQIRLKFNFDFTKSR